ncbi:MAG: prepilin-type N-terminal cleavage/methylation domain-containing protein [Candidatus Omnitrophica bacterium]|nr:prepilin-type N-terminal cleavage/methylation domain-containing protein [Candidatus Omnitrophota bacterium]
MYKLKNSTDFVSSQNKNGFTLLEIIVVIVIVGVLGSLALPRYFAQAEFSRSAEAMISIKNIRESIQRCRINYPSDVSRCANFDDLDIEDPGAAPDANFSYTWWDDSI